MLNTHKNNKNWFQRAFDAVPNGEAAAKKEEIKAACEISEATFYRWMKTGQVPKAVFVNQICEILNFEMHPIVNNK